MHGLIYEKLKYTDYASSPVHVYSRALIYTHLYAYSCSPASQAVKRKGEFNYRHLKLSRCRGLTLRIKTIIYISILYVYIVCSNVYYEKESTTTVTISVTRHCFFRG